MWGFIDQLLCKRLILLAGNLHYNSRKEIRNLGVGFYQFSANEDERHEQMQKLNELRQSTVEGRDKATALRESKKDAKEARKRLIMEKSQQAKRRKEETKEQVDDFLKSLQS